MRLSMWTALAALVVTTALSGCASRDVQDLQDEVDRLEALVEGLNTDIEDLRDELVATRAESDGLRDDVTHTAMALVVIDFGAARNTTWIDLVPFDDRTRPSSPAYTAQGATHPDAYTAHDAMTQWATRHGHRFNATWFAFDGSGGYFIDDIAGASAPDSFWALFVNGRPSPVGMSQTVVKDGDTVEWRLTPFTTA